VESGLLDCCGGICYDGENACCDDVICDDPDAGCCPRDSGPCCSGSCCDDKTCYDPATKKCCGFGNGTVCDKDEICCDDGSCKPTCEDGEPTGQCDTSHNEDYGCIGCTVIPHICSSFKTRVYTGKEVRYCTGGCPGDCVQQDAVECYVECECKYGLQQDYSICGTVGEGLACLDLPFVWYCSPCVKNNQECEIEYAYPKKCQ